MKKYIAFLLCLIMILSLFSCGKENIRQDTNKQDQNENTENASNNVSNNVSNNTTVENYRSIVEIYRLIVEKFPVVNQNPLAVAAELGIQDESEKESFLRLYSSIHQFYPGRGQEDSLSPHYKLGCGYAIKDLNGDGVDELVLLTDEYRIIAVYSLINDVPTLLGSYIKKDLGWSFRNWIDAEGRVHVVRTDGLDLYHHSISEISNGHLIELCTYGYDVFSENGVIVGKLYQTIHDNTVFITEQEVAEFDRQYGNPLNVGEAGNITMASAKLTFTSLYTEAEIAMEMYEAFLKNEIKALDGYLKNCREEYLKNYLWERNGGIDYAYVDMDGDGQVELLVRGIDTFIFSYSHESNEITYVSLNDFREMNRVYIDGSYSWTWGGGGDGVTYGIKKNGKDVWRIENDGGSNPLYYIGERSVTEEEILKYFEDNPTQEEVKFTAISGEGWNKVIDSERAEEIASEYWHIKDGDINEQTGKEYSIDVSGIEGERYYIRLHSGYYYEPDIDFLYIDAITGNIIEDTLSEGKG